MLLKRFHQFFRTTGDHEFIESGIVGHDNNLQRLFTVTTRKKAQCIDGPVAHMNHGQV